MIAIAFLGLLASTGPHLEVTVEANGAADVVPGEAARAEARALLEAQRAAVEQGAGVLLRSETEVREYQLVRDLIQTKAVGYLTRYEVIDRRVEAGVVRVTIRAVVRLAPLAWDLLEIDAVAERLGRPRLSVTVRERRDGRRAEPSAVAAEMQRLLLARGIEVIEPDAEPAPEVRITAEVDLYVHAGPAGGLYTGRAAATAEAIEVVSRTVLASAAVDVGGRPERPGHTAFSAGAAAQGTARKVASALVEGGDGLLAQIFAAWLQRPTVLTIQFEAPATLHAHLREALQQVPGVDGVITRSLEDGMLTLELRGPATREDLLAALAGLGVAGHRLELREVAGSRVTGILAPR